MPKLLSIDEATRLGFTIDSHAPGRPYAYKGPRFAPTEGQQLLTELETKLYALVLHLLTNPAHKIDTRNPDLSRLTNGLLDLIHPAGADHA